MEIAKLEAEAAPSVKESALIPGVAEAKAEESKTIKTSAKNALLAAIPIPKADRLVIDLRNDSTDDSSDEDVVGDSITALLKSARQTVEMKDAENVPRALSHLPLHQQEEYQRLKQEIVRRQNRLVNQTAPSPNNQTNLNQLAAISNAERIHSPQPPKPDELNTVVKEKEKQIPDLIPTNIFPSTTPRVSPPVSSNPAPVPAVPSPRMLALKQQLVRKK